MTNERVAKASLVALLDGDEGIDASTRLAIERALAELDTFEALAGSVEGVATDSLPVNSLDRAIEAVQLALSTAAAIPVLVALGTAGRLLAQSRLAFGEVE